VSAEFVASVRAQSGTLRAGAGGSWLIRVEIPDVWDVVRVEAAPETPVREVKELAIAHLAPDADESGEFVTKLSGVEVVDENQSLESAGVKNGSTLLVTYRRRRPVR
jgi:hypothetical protein